MRRSDWQTIWIILAQRTAREDRQPFEIDSVVPEVATALGVDPSRARSEIGFLAGRAGPPAGGPPVLSA